MRNGLWRDRANTGVLTVLFWSKLEENSIYSNRTTGPTVSIWPCNISVMLPSKVITPKSKQKQMNICYWTKKIQWYDFFLMEFRVRQRSDIRSASRIICCLSYLVHYLVGYYAVMIFILTFWPISFRYFLQIIWTLWPCNTNFLLISLNIEWHFLGPLFQFRSFYIIHSIGNIHVWFYFPNS